ncbi:protein stum [Pectinophora gossypiella]|uniref:protein stum n=1 Tax=Pectinophora gossypiella TaxID=13191 RepID=UPI00214E9355|nr:protein stum [Pectinophora gossypiella]
MALKLKYTDEHGILHINMSPNSSPTRAETESDKTEINDPKFDTINNRFGQYDLFGGKYEKYEDTDSGDVETRSLFRSRYNSIEEELANTPYAFATERSLRFNALNHSPLLDITIERGADVSPSKDIEDDRFFNRNVESLFGPTIETKSSDEDTSGVLDTPAFTVTQLIHAQDRYFDLSSRQSVSPKGDIVSVVRSESGRRGDRVKGERVKSAQVTKDEAFKVLSAQTAVKAVQVDPAPASLPVVPTAKRKREKSFAILTETPSSRHSSRPSSPRSLPVERTGRVSPFRGRGFREETSRHTTPKTSAANSRATSPLRRRTSSLSRIDSMAAATLPPPLPPIQLNTPHTPRDFVKENIEEIRELSELNREKNEAEAEKKRQEEEEALLKEMGLLDKNAKSDAIRSVVCSRTTSRSNSPTKIKVRSRSNSPAAVAVTAVTPAVILRFEDVPTEKRFINQNDGMAPVTHKSRIRSVSRSQPQSNDGSPKHSKIPKRQNSVSPHRKREKSSSRRSMENGLKNQRFISNSTSSIHETIRIGSQVHDKRIMSKSTQHLSISPTLIKGKPPISPGRGGPPPSNRAINSKRLSPIVGTPNKSPTEDAKPSSARTTTKPNTTTQKPVKTAGSTPATSRFTSRQPSRNVSREPSPDKRRTVTKPSTAKPPANTIRSKPVARAVSTKTTQKPIVNKTEPKKPINRTNSMKSLTRTPSTKTLNEKPPLLKKRDSKKDLKAQSTSKLDEIGKVSKKETVSEKKPPVKAEKPKDAPKKANDDKSNEKNEITVKEESTDTSTGEPLIPKQDSETQYDKVTNDKGELVIMTKKSIMSMTTAAITSQPLEVVTKVTNQLPTTLEKAREKGIFERHSSKDSIIPKEDEKDQSKTEIKDIVKEKEEEKHDDNKHKTKPTLFSVDNVKLKPLLPPYNNPQVERVKQKIDDILKSPEVSTENITSASSKGKDRERSSFRNIADKTKSDLKDAKDETTKKFSDLKDQVVKQNEKVAEKVEAEKTAAEKAITEKSEKVAADIRTEASKIVDSIMTPVEEPKVPEKPKSESKKDIEPIVMVVNEKTNGPSRTDILEKMTETLVKGEPEVEVQSSNMSTPGVEKMAMQNKMADGNGSDKSTHSNGGFPQSTSTTPKPPARQKKEHKEDSKPDDSKETTPDQKPPNLCQRLMGKCKKCCACCVKNEEDEEDMEKTQKEEKKGIMSRLNCCKKKEKEQRDAEMAAGKVTSIEFESETKRKRKLRDVMCGCCGRKRRVSDVWPTPRVGDVTGDVTAPAIVDTDTGCCGRGKRKRRDSILSDQQPNTCCNNRLFNWMRGCCRRQQSEQISASRRQSLFSKNKSLSPTLPPEDTRTKLDPSLVEHTSMIRGAIPVLPIALAYFCLFCNIIVPGLGTIFSGMFCLCFGIPRFGIHDGAKYRIGAFVINLLVGCGQLFTVLFCLVGWGWSIWWGVIMVRTARKYRKLKAEEAQAQEAEAPPVTANNHTRA